MAPRKQPNDERARKTIYVTGFNSKMMKKHLLKELFSQGGPVTDITMFDTHAYILFQHEESVPYCLALFNEVELFGEKLRLNPRSKSENNFCYMKYLAEVRARLRDEYAQVKPPNLPAKRYSSDKQVVKDRRHRRSHDRQSPRRAGSNFSSSFETGIVKARRQTSSSSSRTNNFNKSTSNSRKRKRGGATRAGKPRRVRKIVNLS